MQLKHIYLISDTRFVINRSAVRIRAGAPSGLKFIPLILGVSNATFFVCTKVNSADDLELNKVNKLKQIKKIYSC